MVYISATDVVENLYDLYRNGGGGDVSSYIAIVGDTVPQEATELLAPLSLVWSELPRALQLGILWDLGYATTTNRHVVAYRVQCGFSSAAAFDHSTFALPTCAISVPSNEIADTSVVAWLNFDSTSLLPQLLNAPTSNQELMEASTMTPCTTSQDVFDSWCLPERDPTLLTWLHEYRALSAQHSEISSSEQEASVPPSVPFEVPASTPSQSPILDRSVTDFSSPMNFTFATNDDSGLASDFASVFYDFRASGGTLPRLALRSILPADIQVRLDTGHQKFSSLTGLLQRALLWDTGYVLVQHAGSAIAVDVVPVYVKCGLRMSDLALDAGYYGTTGCPVRDCSALNVTSGSKVLSYRAGDCSTVTNRSTSVDLQSLSRCAVPSDAVNAVNVPMSSSSTAWAVGNMSSSVRDHIPHIWLQQQPTLASRGREYAIHTASVDVPVASCPNIPSFIIPCVLVDRPSLQQEWCRPIQTELVKTWLRQEQHQELALATLILLAGAILLALALDLFADRKPRFFRNGRVSATSVPSLTSTILDGIGEQPQTIHSDRTGWSSIRSARSVRSNR